MKTCPNCGKEVESKAQFCPNCGYKFIRQTSDLENDRWTRQQHKEFEEESNEEEQRVKPKSGKGKTVTIIILLLIILGAAGGVIYGFGSQLLSNHQKQGTQSERPSKKVIKETNSDGMSNSSSSESSDNNNDSSSSSSNGAGSSSSSDKNDAKSKTSSKMQSITNRDGSVLSGFFNSLSDAATNGGDSDNLSNYFVGGNNNASIKQYQDWSKGQSNNADLSNVTCKVQNLSMNSGAGHSNADFDVKYHFTYNDGETKTQIFKFNAQLERDNAGNYKIVSCDPESKPIYSSNN